MIPLNPNVALLKRRPRALIFFLALLSATPAMTTDMYLAAIPVIAEEWSVSISLINLSLVLWFVAFSVGLVFCGIFSDRLGRKPVAIGGVCLFMLASALCSMAQSAGQLITFRILQGIAAAAPSAMCLAICRDCYEGQARKKALAWIGIILLLAPMLAPFVGAFILENANWRTIFMVLTALGGLLILGLSLFYRETIATRETGPASTLFKAYGRLARNKNYLLATLTMSLAVAPGFAFVGFSTIVYLNIYAVDNRTFAFLFGTNALSLMLGSLLCTRLIGFFRDDLLIAAGLIGGATAGTLLLFFGGEGYIVFASLMAVYSFSFGITRPLANNLILDQVNRDIGTASSMIIFVQFVSGATMMALATAPWERPLLAFGLMVCIVPTTVVLSWPYIKRQLYAGKQAVADQRFNESSQEISPATVSATAAAPQGRNNADADTDSAND